MSGFHPLQTEAARLKGNSKTGPEPASERKLISGGLTKSYLMQKDDVSAPPPIAAIWVALFKPAKLLGRG